jgi:hypothetical protein
VLAALRPPAFRVWASALLVLPLLPGAASASSWEDHFGSACEVHSHDDALTADVLARCEAAVPAVRRAWPDWDGHVSVFVAKDVAELGELLPGTGDLTDTAALATDTVFVNPEAYASLTPAGRQVVLTHEVTHVATRPVSGVPTWLAEGFAEQVANSDGLIPLPAASQELAAEISAGRLPAFLPDDAEFGAGDVAVHYEQAWRAVDLVARTYGQHALRRWYRSGGDPAALGTTQEALDELWRLDLLRTFS